MSFFFRAASRLRPLPQELVRSIKESLVALNTKTGAKELNLRRNRLKALQHELACSRAALKAKTSELEEAKKTMKLRDRQPQQKKATRTAHHLGSNRIASVKDGGAILVRSMLIHIPQMIWIVQAVNKFLIASPYPTTKR